MAQHPRTSKLNAARFRRLLVRWYRVHARVLPWRGVDDPYKVWISEIMLQQTRVQAVIEHYRRFLKQFPTIQKLAAADEQTVLAAWSGLGYYRRARMMHGAARLVSAEHGGRLPQTAAALRSLPGIGEYTSAAIASIAYGERVAVVDGNVERVLLRVTGRPEDVSAAGKKFIAAQATALLPAAMPDRRAPQPFSEHNQAMMELGATVCLPRGPLCGECPVHALCLTRGEHRTLKRARGLRREAAYLLAMRKRNGATQVLLVQRAADASLMAGMWELPPLSAEVVAPYTPVLAVKHSITNTNYDVSVYTDRELEREVAPGETVDVRWVAADALGRTALTGLTRKILRKMEVMQA